MTAPFYTVLSGAIVNAADPNQYANTFNGTTGTQTITPTAATNSTAAFIGYLPSPPTGDQFVIGASVAGDSSTRLALYVRGDGYGGLWAGSGTTITAKWYAQSSGWVTPQSITVQGALTVSGSTSLAGLNTSGAGTIGGTLSVGSTVTTGGDVNLAGGGHYWLNNTSINGESVKSLSLYGVAGGAGAADIYLVNNGGGYLYAEVPVGNHIALREQGMTTGRGFVFFYNSNNVVVMQNDITGNQPFGWKRYDGTALAELKGNGNLYTLGSVNANGSASFDAFHLAEAYAVAARVPVGTIVCPDDAGQLVRCTHDACPHALIAAAEGGYNIGAEDDHTQFMALTGRVPGLTTDSIPAKAWLTSNGAGGVRALRPGEHAVALGFALTPSDGTKVLIFVRPHHYQEP